MDRERVSSGTEWESTVGYSRAVRAGDEIHVSGTTATDEDGAVVAPGDPYAQTVRAIENVADALSALDASLADVVRTRLFVTDIDEWEAVGRAHGEAFGDSEERRSSGSRPATTMVQVERLIDPEMLVEIEAVARD
jgi:enamine deaminase RidA (YjgF/YER057c/UK114 family)